MLKIENDYSVYIQQFYGCHLRHCSTELSFRGGFCRFFLFGANLSLVFCVSEQPKPDALYYIRIEYTLHKLTDTATLLMNTFLNLLWFNTNEYGGIWLWTIALNTEFSIMLKKKLCHKHIFMSYRHGHTNTKCLIRFAIVSILSYCYCSLFAIQYSPYVCARAHEMIAFIISKRGVVSLYALSKLFSFHFISNLNAFHFSFIF